MNNLNDLGPSFTEWDEFKSLPAAARYAIKCAAFYKIRYIVQRDDVFGICLIFQNKMDVEFVNLYTVQKYDVIFEQMDNCFYRIYCEK